MLASKASETVYKLSPSQSLANNTYETDNRPGTRGWEMPVLITCGPPSSYPTLLIPYFRISAYPSIRILVFTNTGLQGTVKFHPP